MDRVLPASVDALIAKTIETVYSYGPLAEKTVILGKKIARERNEDSTRYLFNVQRFMTRFCSRFNLLIFALQSFLLLSSPSFILYQLMHYYAMAVPIYSTQLKLYVLVVI